MAAVRNIRQSVKTGPSLDKENKVFPKSFYNKMN